MNIFDNKLLLYLFNKLRKWINYHQETSRKHVESTLFDSFRPADICIICNSKVNHLADIPYCETFLNKWNARVNDFFSVVPSEYQNITFPYEFCPACFFVYQSKTISTFTNLIENNDIVNNIVLAGYETQTQIVVNESLVENLLNPNYTKSVIEDHYLTLLKRIKLQITSNQKYLDLGCNRGSFAELVRLYLPEIDVWGCEINQVYIKSCRERFPQVSLITEALSEERKHNSFDFVFCSDVIEHIWNLDSFILAIKNNLKESGKVMFVTPNICSSEAIKNGINWWGYIPPHHTQLFSPFAIERLLNKHGFQLIDKGEHEQELFCIFQLERI